MLKPQTRAVKQHSYVGDGPAEDITDFRGREILNLPQVKRVPLKRRQLLQASLQRVSHLV